MFTRELWKLVSWNKLSQTVNFPESIRFKSLVDTIFYRFTLYPAYNSIGRGRLVLRQSVPHFWDIVCRVVEFNAALCLLRERVKKIVIRYLGWKPNLQIISTVRRCIAPPGGHRCVEIRNIKVKVNPLQKLYYKNKKNTHYFIFTLRFM